jgi:type III restriction enzyme
MRLVLKDFQLDAVDDLVQELFKAAREVLRDPGDAQAVGLSSPTGSGKTVMLTASIERLLEGDSESTPLPDAVFLWITDQPQLNEQTRRKMLKDSSVLNEGNIVTIGPAFDQEVFTPGTVNFLNIQKLGKEKDLITKGDKRNYTIWETVTNSITAIPDRFFVVIDEAHRGMNESAQAIAEANTIIQKFIKGSPGEIPRVPLIVGISATLERFNRLVSGTDRILRPIPIPVEAVRASGLLKEVVTLHHPTKDQPADITMLREAVKSWRRFKEAWERYSAEQDETGVRPILVVQVEDAVGARISKTDLEDAVKAIEAELGGLPPSAFAHSFQEGTTQMVAGKEIRYLAPADIDSDPEVQIVFFKTSLNTGWDCPRAEVMMSFRKAVDATSIAQLVGRMVRTPLARHVETSDFLNSVALYLPHYDQPGLNRVIERLTKQDPEIMPPVEFRRGEDQVTVVRSPKVQERVFKAIENLSSYVIPAQRKTSQVKRLMKLARALAKDELEADAEDMALSLLVDVLATEFKRVSRTENFKKLVEERGKVEIRAVDWQVGLDLVEEDSKIVLDVSSEDIDDLFETAGRRVGDEGLHLEWLRIRRNKKVETSIAKLELVSLSIDPDLRKTLDQTAQRKINEWLKKSTKKISLLPENRRQVYDEIWAKAGAPVPRPIFLPKDMIVRKSESLWDRHIYTDEAGKYPADLNKWESAVVERELNSDKNAVWLRNLPRKSWALTIPHRAESGKWTPVYPDLIFVHEKDGELAIDLLDPHTLSFADAPAKAAGLAEHAKKHAEEYNRMELIIMLEDGEVRSIDLTDEAKRDKVLGVNNQQHLADLFDLLGS